MAVVDYPKLDYPEGTLLVDVRYYSYPEKFEVVFFNPITNTLDVKYEDPLIDIWFLKEDYRTNKYQIAQTKNEHAYKIICKPSQVSQAIAKNIGGEWAEWYESHKGVSDNRAMNEHMCKCPWVFKADFTEDVYFRLRWLQTYGRKYDLSKVTYGLLDIETDVLDATIDLKDIHDVKQPINAITVILPEQKICAVHVLAPRPESKLHESYHGLLKKQKQDYEWMITHQEEFKRRIIEDDEDNKKYLDGYRVDLWFFDYEREIDMIKNVFLYINKYRPMFMMSWNAKFDHNYLKGRIEWLGYDPVEFFVPEEFKYHKLYYKEDKNPKAVIKTSRDWFFTSTFTTYICQMRLFAAIRKSQQERRSYSLTSVGDDVAGIIKLSDEKPAEFRKWAYMDLIMFILYNVRDVVVQLAVEVNCNDCRTLMSRSYMFATQFSKCFQETHIVRNIREFYYEKLGFIQACRLIVDPGIDTHFQGAFVADPTLNAVTGYAINGKYVNNIIYGALDADAKSYYPSTKMGLNLDPMALEYKCIVLNDVFINGGCNNRSLNQNYIWYDSDHNPHPVDVGAYLFNSYKNHNEASVLNNYFNLPSITEYMSMIDHALENKRTEEVTIIDMNAAYIKMM